MSTNDEIKIECAVCVGSGWVGGQGGDTCGACNGRGYNVIATMPAATSIQTLKGHASLKFSELEQACHARNKEWWQGTAATIDKRLFFGVELGEETGEVCGAIKKLHRQQYSMPTGEPKTVFDLADELADVVITAQNIASEYGINLGSAVRIKFNATSEKRGFTTKL